LLASLALPDAARLEATLPAVLPANAATDQLRRAQVTVERAHPAPSAEALSGRAGALSVESLVRPDETLRKSIESFLLDQRSPHTQRAYGKDLKRFVQFLLLRKYQGPVNRIDRALLVSYKDFLLGEGLEHTTIDRHLATLRSFFRWLQDDGLITDSPAERVRFLNPKRVSRTVGFSDEEVVRILKEPNLHLRTGSLHYAVLMVLFYCGLRRSEVCSIRTTQLGVERGHRVVRLRGKGNAERVVVMVPAVWNAIQHYLMISRRQLSEDSYLFRPIKNRRTGELDKPLDPSMIFYIVKRYARLAGIENRVSPHSCRATAISNARDHNVPDRAIQEFAGWASPDMITRYDKRKASVESSAAHAIKYEEGAKKSEREIPRAPKDPEGGV
jgi:integrase/recombinase XerD